MLSRVAENLFWIGRYMERAENLARLLDVGFDLELDAAGVGLSDAGPMPVESVLDVLACREAFVASHGPATHEREAVLRFLTFDRQHDHSILSMITRARENARGTQEALGGEAWSHLNTLYLTLNRPRARKRFESSPARFFSGLKRSCVLFTGLVEGTLPRTEAFYFLQMGRGLERTNAISRIVQVTALAGLETDDGYASPLRAIRWTALLRSCAAHESYLRLHSDRVDPAEVVRYLLLSAEFPRSIRFSVTLCCGAIKALSGDSPDGPAAPVDRRLGRLDSELRYLDDGEIVARGLSPFLSGVQQACNTIGDDIQHAYFSS